MIQTLELHNLSCGACAETIRTALDLAGFTSVKVNLRKEPHTVTAEIIDDEHLELLKTVLRGHGYPPLDDDIDLPTQTEFNFS